jgi:2-polyprenyl-3-methyl-5-hydroxy-6-metoxy-1,4-benzoquinol methylase
MHQLTPEDLICAYPEIDFLVAEGNVSSSYMISIHKAFYQFAAEQIHGGKVLDAGCGTGFGTAMLSQKADCAVGVDIKYLLLKYGLQHYSTEGLYFEAMDVNQLGFADESFDVVVANELMEHLPEHRLCINEVLRILRPGGLFICATVNSRHTFGIEENPLNRNHFREFSLIGFKIELEQYFGDINILGQGYDEEFKKFMQNRSARTIEWILMKLNIKHRIPACWRSRVRSLITGTSLENKRPEEFSVTDHNVLNSIYLVATARKKR